MAVGILVNFSAFLSVVVLIIATFLLLFFLSYYYQSEIKFGWVEKVSVIAIVSYGFSSIMSLMILVGNDSHSKVTKFLGLELQLFSWRIASISIFILFTKRLQSIFRNVKFIKYSLPKCVYKSINIQCVILTKLLLIDIVVFGLSFYGVIDRGPYIAFTVASYIIDTICSLILIVSIMKRLRLISWEHGVTINKYQKELIFDESDDFEQDDIEKEQNSKKAKKDKYIYKPSMFQQFSRIAILCTYSIVSSKVYIILDVINEFFVSDNEWSSVFTSCILPINCLINIACIFLSFQFADMWYYDTCNVWEKRCAKLCTNKSKQTQQMNDLQESLLE